jgi:hypothetical protein
VVGCSQPCFPWPALLPSHFPLPLASCSQHTFTVAVTSPLTSPSGPAVDSSFVQRARPPLFTLFTQSLFCTNASLTTRSPDIPLPNARHRPAPHSFLHRRLTSLEPQLQQIFAYSACLPTIRNCATINPQPRQIALWSLRHYTLIPTAKQHPQFGLTTIRSDPDPNTPWHTNTHKHIASCADSVMLSRLSPPSRLSLYQTPAVTESNRSQRRRTLLSRPSSPQLYAPGRVRRRKMMMSRRRQPHAPLRPGDLPRLPLPNQLRGRPSGLLLRRLRRHLSGCNPPL